jgi:hypothetical protein
MLNGDAAALARPAHKLHQDIDIDIVGVPV